MGMKLPPCQEAREIQRLQEEHKLSLMALAIQLNVSDSYLGMRLRLLKLHPDVAVLVDDRTIPLMQGYLLSFVPKTAQSTFWNTNKHLKLDKFRRLIRVVYHTK